MFLELGATAEDYGGCALTRTAFWTRPPAAGSKGSVGHAPPSFLSIENSRQKASPNRVVT